jgi:23S rRNA A2030 N6-methylase RlmJ
MANHHFGKLADVWKHLPLTEIIHLEQPAAYWESHAGSALYPMGDDPERDFGAQRFFRVSAGYPILRESRYRQQLLAYATARGQLTSYPGSPMLAMSELGAGPHYRFCDLDAASVADIRKAARTLGLGSTVTVVASDGMTALRDASATEGARSVLAHIDPFDPYGAGPGGFSALDLAVELISQGIALVYWYGYSDPEERAWAFVELSQRCRSTSLWCGDIMVASPGQCLPSGDLGTATTPGTGFGIVCANLRGPTLSACERLGRELVLAYDGADLPGGGAGSLDFWLP